MKPSKFLLSQGQLFFPKRIHRKSHSLLFRLLFKLAVEQSMTANILASDINADLDDVEKLRSRCVHAVKQINFEDALKYSKSG